MAKHKSFKKQVKVNKRKHMENLKAMNLCKSYIRKLKKETNKESAEKLLKDVYKQIDKNVCKKRIKKNTGARQKSKFARYVNSLS